jgi:rubrerythrin
MFRFRFGEEKDFQTNMAYRCYLTGVHFIWECPACGVSHNEYHEEGCPIERHEQGTEVFAKVYGKSL